jgi:glycosyltransferase involved in cell wall biosynthesis
MIKVAYDYQIFSLQIYGGVSRYFVNLALALAENPEFQIEIEAGLYINKLIHSTNSPIINGTKINYIPNLNRAIMIFNYWSSNLKFRIDRPDIIHGTYYQKPVSFLNKSYRVITVHDMIHEKFRDSIKKEEFIAIKRQAIESADRIISVSHNTTKDVINILKVNPEKIQTVYLGHSIQNFGSKDRIPLIEVPYILFVGERGSYKNFARFIKAYANHQQIWQNFQIVCFGTKPFSRQETNLFQQLGINTGKLRHISGDDSILANLYAHASALVYPSLYEGFGISPLEAMSFGCPVICSNISSIPEIVADAGEYFDPYDLESIGEAMTKVLFDSMRSKDLIEKGKERVKFFSWDKCALETANVYRQLL